MKEKKTSRDGKLFRPGIFAACYWIIGPAIIVSVLSVKPSLEMPHFFSGLFSVEAAVDVEKQKADIEKAFDKTQELLSAVKIQDLRGTIDLLERKISKIKSDISADEASAYASKVDKVKKSATIAEDSLVNRAFDILSAQGQDSALFYTANELRIHGVTESKISAAEKKILKEGPAIKQAKDQETIVRIVKLLESGQKPDPSTDRFLLQSAQRMVKMRQDSLKAIEDSKNKKDIDEQKRQEKARLDKEKKEKKDEEERQAALKKDEEKKQREAEKAEKKRMDEEDSRTKQFRDAQEQARKDSIETAKKLDEGKETARREAAKRLEDAKFAMDRKPQADVENRQKPSPRQEKARRDSIEMQQRKLEEARQFMEQENRQKSPSKQDKLEKARRDSIEAKRKAQEELASHQEELRRMMEDELKEKQRQGQLQEEREAKLLQKQQAEQQERARRDSIDAYRKDQELQKQQEKERRFQMARTEKDRSRGKGSKDDVGTSGKQQTASSEADRWGLGPDSKDESVEERKERERVAKMLEDERQKKSLREIQEVQRLARLEKARQDSIDSARRLQDQQDNQRRIAEERRMKVQQEKERRLSEEQKKQEEIENQRRIAEERKMQVQQEKDRRLAEDQRKRDQLENQRRITAESKERDRQENQRQMEDQRKQRDYSSRPVDEDRQDKNSTRQEKPRKVVVEAQQIPISAKPDMEQDEIQQLLANVRKEKDRLTRLEHQLQAQIEDKQERARQDSINDAAKRYRVSQAARPTLRDDPEARRRILQNDDERKRQLLALQDKARLDYQKRLDEEKAKLERDRRRWQQARQESMHRDNASSGKRGVLDVDIDKDAAKYDQGPDAGLPRQTSAYFLPPPKDEPAQSPSRRANVEKVEQQQNEKASQENDWKSKEKRRRSEKFVADIYKSMEKNQVKKARQLFDANRDYISQYADPEVFNMVEQTIITAESAAAKAPPRAQVNSERTASYTADVPPPRTQVAPPAPPVRERVVKPEPRPEPVISKSEPVVSAEVNWDGNELEFISRINGFVRDGNGKAAYKEFKKVEEQLKNYFTVEEFNHFKSMVENANKRD
jgi:hypothetical protein